MEYYEKSKNLRKIDRNNAIRMMRDNDKSYQDIGDYFGITRQRVHQILKDYAMTNNRKSVRGYKTEHLVCEICGSNEKLHIHHIDRNRRNNKHENLMRICQNCHYELHSGRKIDKVCLSEGTVDKLKNKHKKSLLTYCKEWLKIK